MKKDKFEQTSFQKERKKRILCPNDGAFLCETHLGEKNWRIERCKKCGNIVDVPPPMVIKKAISEGGKINWKKYVIWAFGCTPTPNLPDIEGI